MVFPKPEETAVLTVNGAKFSDWESVKVKHEMFGFPFLTARFTCSEGMPLAKNWAALRIVPGMTCKVELAGIEAITGEVSTRQVAVDARRHHIEIQVVSATARLASSSVVHKTHEVKDTTFKKFADDLVKQVGLKFVEQGGSIPSFKFPRISIIPGSSIFEALEVPLRSLGGIGLTTDKTGALVACVGPNGGGDTVYEGELGWPSYIEANEVFYNSGVAKGLNHMGSIPPSDQVWGTAATHEKFYSQSFDSFSDGKQAHQMESPAWDQDHMKGRSGTEGNLQGQDQITVFVVVNGWIKPTGGLWEVNKIVSVISPMLVLKGTEELKTKSVTYEQDNQIGTRTTLELCNRAALSGFRPQEGQP